jgi:hypothetical protein
MSIEDKLKTRIRGLLKHHGLAPEKGQDVFGLIQPLVAKYDDSERTIKKLYSTGDKRAAARELINRVVDSQSFSPSDVVLARLEAIGNDKDPNSIAETQASNTDAPKRRSIDEAFDGLAKSLQNIDLETL